MSWTDEPQFLLQHSDSRFRIRPKHESMDTSCFISSHWWWYNILGDILFKPCGLLVPTEEIVADYVHKTSQTNSYLPWKTSQPPAVGRKTTTTVYWKAHHLFESLPTGKRYQSIKTCTKKFINSYTLKPLPS